MPRKIEVLHTDEQEILLQEWIEEGNEKRSIKEYRKMATERLQTGSSTRSVQLEVHTQRGTATGDDVNAERELRCFTRTSKRFYCRNG